MVKNLPQSAQLWRSSRCPTRRSGTSSRWPGPWWSQLPLGEFECFASQGACRAAAHGQHQVQEHLWEEHGGVEHPGPDQCGEGCCHSRADQKCPSAGVIFTIFVIFIIINMFTIIIIIRITTCFQHQKCLQGKRGTYTKIFEVNLKWSFFRLWRPGPSMFRGNLSHQISTQNRQGYIWVWK